MDGLVLIAVKPATRERLKKNKKYPHETYDEELNRLMEEKKWQT